MPKIACEFAQMVHSDNNNNNSNNNMFCPYVINWVEEKGNELTADVHLTNNQEYKLEKCECQYNDDKENTSCYCCYCCQCATELSIRKHNFIEQWLRSVPSKAEPIIPEELVEVFKFFKQQSIEQTRLATILKERSIVYNSSELTNRHVVKNSDSINNSNDNGNAISNKTHFITLHKNEESKTIMVNNNNNNNNNNVLDNASRRGSYEHILSSEWMDKFPFFSSCLQDLNIDSTGNTAKGFLVEDVINNKLNNEIDNKRNDNSECLSMRSMPLLAHKLPEWIANKEKTVSIVNSRTDVNNFVDDDEDEGGLTSVQQSANNVNSMHKISILGKTIVETHDSNMNNISSDKLSYRGAHNLYENKMSKKMHCEAQCINRNDNNIDSNKDNNIHKLANNNVKTSSNNIGPFRINKLYHYNSNINVKLSNEVNMSICNRDESHRSACKYGLNRQNSSSFASLQKLCDNPHSFIAKVIDFE